MKFTRGGLCQVRRTTGRIIAPKSIAIQLVLFRKHSARTKTSSLSLSQLSLSQLSLSQLSLSQLSLSQLSLSQLSLSQLSLSQLSLSQLSLSQLSLSQLSCRSFPFFDFFLCSFFVLKHFSDGFTRIGNFNIHNGRAVFLMSTKKISAHNLQRPVCIFHTLQQA